MRAYILLLAALPAAAQTTPPVPVFTADTIRTYPRPTKLFRAGMVLEVWGRNLAPMP